MLPEVAGNCLFLLTTEYTEHTEFVNSNGIQLQGSLFIGNRTQKSFVVIVFILYPQK
jgi:hypothetical protein